MLKIEIIQTRAGGRGQMEAFFAPMAYCDMCQQKIEPHQPGLTLHLCTGEGQPFLVHGTCAAAFKQANGGEAVWAEFELQAFWQQVAINSTGVDPLRRTPVQQILG